MATSKEENFLKFIVRRLKQFASPPAQYIDSQSKLRYQFVFVFSLVTCPILVLSQVLSNANWLGVPIFSVAALLVFSSLILSKIGYLKLAIVVDLLSFSLFPYISLIIKETWILEYSLLVIIWIPVTLLIGNYVLDQRESALFIMGHNLVFLITVLVHPGASIFRSAFLETIVPLFGISLLIFVGSLTRQRHTNQLASLNHELEAKNRELNIYTSLLIHDIGNDLHTYLLNIELTGQLLVTNPTTAREYLLGAITVGERMGTLLKIFSEPRIFNQTNIVCLIESIAKDAEISHKNLEINVTSDEQCRRYGYTSSLLPMVFTNLFRNSAAHAGKSPVVEVTITMNDNDIVIVVTDDGPGVDSSIRDSIFTKGTKNVKSEGTGMGLYLIKQIIEIYDGTISLLGEDEATGCGFCISIPRSSFSIIS